MPKLKPKHIIKFVNLVGNKQQQIKLKIALTILALGISIGIAVEEFVGIGTWHQFQIQTDKVNICFTPPSGCGSLIAQQISQAKESIFVQAYSLTSSAIIHQLQQAHKRGVKVFVLLDGGNMSDNQDVFNQLKLAGINAGFDKMPGIAHNKVMIIDKKKVITGSFNFTKAADYKNAENVLLIEDDKIAAAYILNWNKRSAKIN